MKDNVIFHGRPTMPRSEREDSVYDVLDNFGIKYLRIDHQPVKTISQCEDIDRLLGLSICKNLFLCDRKKKSFYLLMLPGMKKLDAGALSTELGVSRLSFAPGEYMADLLNTHPGSLSVLSAMFDKNCKVRVLIDKDLLTYEFTGCHPCVNTSSLKIKTSNITDIFLPGVNHPPIIVNL